MAPSTTLFCALYVCEWRSLASFACSINVKVYPCYCPCYFPVQPQLILVLNKAVKIFQTPSFSTSTAGASVKILRTAMEETLTFQTGCSDDGEFTCKDGQCVQMEERCNQVPDCRDESDENGCQLIVFKDNYNKNIPPIRAVDGGALPAEVSVSLRLMKVVEIKETDHSI